MNPTNDYDRFPYQGGVFDRTHPDHLAVVARLFGLCAKDPREARILEIGCALGANVLPMAAGLPDAQFVGMDLSGVEIEIARERAASLGLRNVELRQANILDIDDSWGRFDYIICHGVYSWVPPEVQTHLFKICRNNLHSGGVAYISYNVLPGWYPMLGVRDLMRAHVEGIDDPKERVAQGRAILRFLAELQPNSPNYWDALMRAVHEDLSRRPDDYILHEYLAPYNTPCTFAEFLNRAAEHDLRYLADADVPSMLASRAPEKAREVLDQLSGQGQVEEYLDIMRGRRFRQTLLVHQGEPIDRNISVDRLDDLYLVCRYECSEEPDKLLLKGGEGVEIRVTDPSLFQAYRKLARDAPQGRTLVDLELDLEDAEGKRAILDCWQHGLIDLMTWDRLGDEPQGNRLAWPPALGVARNELRPGRLHRYVQLSPLGEWLLPLLDGNLDTDGILEELMEAMVNGTLEINLPEDMGEEAQIGALQAVVDHQLRELWRLGVLEPKGVLLGGEE